MNLVESVSASAISSARSASAWAESAVHWAATGNPEDAERCLRTAEERLKQIRKDVERINKLCQL